jgi:hypothetical protein
VLAGATCLAGCSGSGRPDTAPVRGKLTLRGKPVVGATLAFLCDGAPRHAIGTTDSEGNYQLTTFEPNDGAVVGKHVVTIKKFSVAPQEVVIDPSMSPEIMEKARKKAEAATFAAQARAEKAPQELPKKYGHPATSDIRKEVVPGENVINIEL